MARAAPWLVSDDPPRSGLTAHKVVFIHADPPGSLSSRHCIEPLQRHGRSDRRTLRLPVHPAGHLHGRRVRKGPRPVEPLPQHVPAAVLSVCPLTWPGRGTVANVLKRVFHRVPPLEAGCQARVGCLREPPVRDGHGQWNAAYRVV